MQNHEPIWFDKDEKPNSNNFKFSVFVGTPLSFRCINTLHTISIRITKILLEQ